MQQVVGAIVSDVQAGDLMFIQRGGALIEALTATISVDHMTSVTADNVTTVSLWRDAPEASLFGTFQVSDGKDGTGGTFPDFNAGNTYEAFEVAVDVEDLFAYRAKVQTIGNKPQTAGVIHADWERINLGGIAGVHSDTTNYQVGHLVFVNGHVYTPNLEINDAETANGPYPFVVGTGANQWRDISNSPSPILVELSAPITTQLSNANNGQIFQVMSGVNSTLNVGAGSVSGDTYEVRGVSTGAGVCTITSPIPVKTMVNGEAHMLVASITVKPTQIYTLSVIDDGSNLKYLLVTIGGPYPLWVETAMYEEGTVAIWQGIGYMANTHIGANTPFSIGPTKDQWRLPNGVGTLPGVGTVSMLTAVGTSSGSTFPDVIGWTDKFGTIASAGGGGIPIPTGKWLVEWAFETVGTSQYAFGRCSVAGAGAVLDVISDGLTLCPNYNTYQTSNVTWQGLVTVGVGNVGTMTMGCTTSGAGGITNRSYVKITKLEH